MFSIGQLSDRTGVKVPTIRYYEAAGLMPEPGRTTGGQRRYDGSALDRLSFIRHARDLGFPLDAVRELLTLQDGGHRAEAIARAHLDGIRIRIDRLRRLESELQRIAMDYDGNGTCAVLQALSDYGPCASDHGKDVP